MDELYTNYLSVTDYTVLVSTLIISALIGVYYNLSGGRQQTTGEYLLADQSMPILPVAFSLMASFMSAITLLGVASENYMFGTQFLAINISYLIGTPIAAFIFLPVFYELKVTSIYEYLAMRFNHKVRMIASLVFMMQMTIYMSIVLYAPALALSAVTGISKWISILSVGLVCTLYCTIGGIKAVLWTDVFQSMLMFLAMIIIIVKGSIDVGGIDVVLQRAYDTNRIQFFNLDVNPMTRHTMWSLAFGGIFIYVSLYGVNQTQVQRLLTVKTLRKSQISLFISCPITSFLSVITALTGLVIYANFWKCDPISKKYISKSDQLLPYYVMKSLSSYPGLPGIIIAGIFSGALSSVSSFVNSLAAVTLQDCVKPYFFKQKTISDKTEILIAKTIALSYGLLCILLTVVVEQMSGILQAALTLFGIIGGPLLMLFTAGMCFNYCNSNGVITGFIVSLAIGFWIGIGNYLYGTRPIPLPLSTVDCANNITQLTNNLSQNNTLNNYATKVNVYNSFYIYNISYMWYAAFTWAIGLIIAIIISKLTSSKNIVIDESLLTPLMRTKSFKTDQLIDKPIAFVEVCTEEQQITSL